MAKWISPVFTDIRNQVGKSVVFSIWKGRVYFRQYTKPANPKTAKQMANRAQQAYLVKRWQEIIDTADKKAAWNAVALPDGLPGYNLFIKEGRKSQISCPATATLAGTPASVDVTVTYTLGFGASNARLYMFDGTEWTDVTPDSGLTAGTDQTATVTITAAGTYYFYIADSRPLVPGDTPPLAYQAITDVSRDEVNGTIVEAKCVVS